LAADSLNWNNLRLGAGTRLGKFFNVNYNSSYSFYDQNRSTGTIIRESLISNEKFFMRQVSSGGGINLNLTGDSFKKKVAKPSQLEEGEFSETDELDEEQIEDLERDDVNPNTFNVPWSVNLSYTLNRSRGWNSVLARDTFSIRQGLIMNGSLSLGENWSFTAQSGLDLTNGKPELTPTILTVFRNLHCWELSANIIPFGDRKSYTFTINVKASALRDLKANRTFVSEGGGFLF
jgi:hypothetical protein